MYRGGGLTLTICKLACLQLLLLTAAATKTTLTTDDAPFCWKGAALVMNAKWLGCPDIGAPTATFPQLHWHTLRVADVTIFTPFHTLLHLLRIFALIGCLWHHYATWAVRHADEVCDDILHHPHQLQPQPITARCDYFHIAWPTQLFWRDGGVSPSEPHLARRHFAPCTCGGSYYLQPASQTRLTVGNALHIILTLCSSGPPGCSVIWPHVITVTVRTDVIYLTHNPPAHDLSACTLANKRPGLKYVLICKKQQKQH